MKRSTTCWLLILFALGCGPKDRVGRDVISDEAAIGAGAQSVSVPNNATSGSSARSASGVGTLAAGSGMQPQSAAGRSGTGAAGQTQPPAANGGKSGSDAAPSGGGDPGSAGHAAAGEPGNQGTAGTAANSGEGPADAECDLRGIWIVRLTTFSRDSVFNSVQTASNWFYYEFEQHGREASVSKALDCGFQVSGSADVTLNAKTTESLMHPNDQTGRRAEFYKEGNHCAFKFARWYSVRGMPRAKYLAADLSQNPELASLTPPLPSEQMPAGAEDWDKDGSPGIAINVAGIGSRHVVQRDWNAYFSEASGVALNANQLMVRADFDNQEQILAVSGGLGALLRASSVPASNLNHRAVFRRLGRSAQDAMVAAVRGSDDLQTCFKIQEMLPHDGASQ